MTDGEQQIVQYLKGIAQTLLWTNVILVLLLITECRR